VMTRDELSVPFDVVGIGASPCNLSVAALLHDVPEVRSIFLERDERFRCHSGQLVPDAGIQAPFFKDLVTPVDPTHACSFLAFLKDKRRLHRYMAARFPSPARVELEEYFGWVCQRLRNLRFRMNVESIELHDEGFQVAVGDQLLRARHLVLGSCRVPRIEERWRGLVGDRVFHGSELLLRDPDLAGKRVAVIGGGQSGAEAFHHLISRPEGARPRELLWISRRVGFLPQDDSPRGPAMAGDGISRHLLERIHQRLYLLDLQGPRRYLLLPGHRVTDLHLLEDRIRLSLLAIDDERPSRASVDTVVLCTGYEHRLPPYLEPLRHRIAVERGELPVRADCSLIWDGPARHRIFVQAAARHLRGGAEPHLSLMAWRGAVIANSIIGRPVFDVEYEAAAVEWPKSRSAKG
jgi:lysine N6-hydroxylase